MKHFQAINKVDIMSAYKFRNVINDKYGVGVNSKELHLAKRLEDKFVHNQNKVVKILKDSNVLKNRVLINK
jgi:hypothetical protein